MWPEPLNTSVRRRRTGRPGDQSRLRIGVGGQEHVVGFAHDPVRVTGGHDEQDLPVLDVQMGSRGLRVRERAPDRHNPNAFVALVVSDKFHLNDRAIPVCHACFSKYGACGASR